MLSRRKLRHPVALHLKAALLLRRVFVHPLLASQGENTFLYHSFGSWSMRTSPFIEGKRVLSSSVDKAAVRNKNGERMC